MVWPGRGGLGRGGGLGLTPGAKMETVLSTSVQSKRVAKGSYGEFWKQSNRLQSILSLTFHLATGSSILSMMAQFCSSSRIGKRLFWRLLLQLMASKWVRPYVLSSSCNVYKGFWYYSVHWPVAPQAFLFITLTTELRFLNRAVNTSRRLDAICLNWWIL